MDGPHGGLEWSIVGRPGGGASPESSRVSRADRSGVPVATAEPAPPSRPCLSTTIAVAGSVVAGRRVGAAAGGSPPPSPPPTGPAAPAHQPDDERSHKPDAPSPARSCHSMRRANALV